MEEVSTACPVSGSNIGNFCWVVNGKKRRRHLLRCENLAKEGGMPYDLIYWEERVEVSLVPWC